MTKIVYNGCYGGFGLSHEAIMRYAEIKGITLKIKKEKYGTTFYDENGNYFSSFEFERNDPALVQVVEELGDKANGQSARLLIEEVPVGTMYRIDEYDGSESVMTMDTYQWKMA